MGNYRIRVANESESKEAQELFFELGYEWKFKNIGKNFHFDESVGFLYADNGCITTGWKDTGFKYFNNHPNKEITLKQLKDLVVLKRNNGGDAQLVDSFGDKWRIDITGDYWMYEQGKWRSALKPVFELKPIEKTMKECLEKQDIELTYRETLEYQNLSEYFIKYLKGVKIQYKFDQSETSQWHNMTEKGLHYFKNPKIQLREAPKYVTLNGVTFKTIESLLKHVKNNYDLDS